MSDMEIAEDLSCYNGPGTTLRKAQLRLLDMLLAFDRICKKHGIQYYISGGTCLGAVRHGGFVPWDDDIDIDVWYTDYNRLMSILPQELPGNFKLQTSKTDPGFYGSAARIVDGDSKVTYPEPGTDYWRRNFAYKGLFIDILPISPMPCRWLKLFIDKYGTRIYRARRVGNLNPMKKYTALMSWPAMAPIIASYQWASRNSHSTTASHYCASMAPTTPVLCRDEIFPSRPICFENHTFQGPNKPQAYLQRLYGDYSIIPPINKRWVHAGKIEIYDGSAQR